MSRHTRDEDELKIDMSAAADIPPDAALRDWARDKRVFISSVMDGLREERKAVATAVRDLGARPMLFEEFGGRDADPEDAYLGEVKASDIYVGIIGRRYGRPLPTRFSATHTEYLCAADAGLRIAIWAMAVPDREGHQQSFLDEVRVFHVVPDCRSPSDLGVQVRERLTTIAAEDIAPWCKLGALVFRSSLVVDRGDELEVTATIRNDSIAHRLEALRGDGGMRGEGCRFSWTGRSRNVRVAGVETSTSSARSRTLKLRLERDDARRDSPVEMTISGMSPTDLVEAALRTALFGEPNPLAPQGMEFFAELPDPLENLRVAAVPDEIVRPLAELLIADTLVGSGRAGRLSRFSLGARVRGERALELAWEPVRRYSDEREGSRSIRGKVRL
jgi:hypothetical protein